MLQPPLDPLTGGSGGSSMYEEEGTEDRSGIWRRRRLLDGSLNRVPLEFYTKMWSLLERCQGLSVQVYQEYFCHCQDLQHARDHYHFYRHHLC